MRLQSQALTHSQLVERASAICASALNEARGVKPPTSSGDLQAFADRAGAIVDRTARQAFDPAIRVELEAMTAGQLESMLEARRGSVCGADAGEEKR
jgi:hypothetical protein